MAMIRTHFPPGSQPTVLTADLCHFVYHGDCSKCPGVASAEDLSPDAKDEPVFCTHACHEKRNHE